MVSSIAYSQIINIPVIVYVGSIVFISFSFTATLGYRYHIGKPLLAFKWHPRMAVISLFLAAIHATLGLSIFLGF
ncbi:MAG: hypothetical protein A2152_01015 [Candidatus Levybacteria bacterium RBG_16_35_6]|nr:MAG: hypothetical protein A2152_01015 [Candidatus Levybacteria bacterium RBG_16_35_6]